MVKKLKELEDDLDNFRSVQYRMDNEGIDYCFENYSSFEDIEDEEFHKLRKEFLESMKNIRSYVENKIEELKSQVDDLEWGDY
jgi:archaellum component FlaC